MLNGKALIILLIVGLINTMQLYKISFLPELHTPGKNKIEIELDLSNYATKSDLKIATDVNTSDFTKKTDLVSLKTDCDQ